VSGQADVIQIDERRVLGRRRDRLQHGANIVTAIGERLLTPFLRLAKRLVRFAAAVPLTAARVLVVWREHPVPAIGERFGEETRLRGAAAVAV
jgi:hypothetical protein